MLELSSEGRSAVQEGRRCRPGLCGRQRPSSLEELAAWEQAKLLRKGEPAAPDTPSLSPHSGD